MALEPGVLGDLRPSKLRTAGRAGSSAEQIQASIKCGRSFAKLLHSTGISCRDVGASAWAQPLCFLMSSTLGNRILCKQALGLPERRPRRRPSWLGKTRWAAGGNC